MQTTTFHGGIYEIEAMIGAEPSIVEMPSMGPATLAAHPAAGCTLTVDFTVSPHYRVADGTARWVRASIGTNGVVSSASAIDIPSAVTAIRAVGTGSGPNWIEVRQ